MPILFAKSFKASDGKCYGTLQEAQIVELAKIIGSDLSESESENIAKIILENKAEVLDVLTLKENSIPKARSVNGGTKKRRAKPVEEPEATQALPGV